MPGNDKESWVLRHVYSVKNQQNPSQWSPIGEYHQPERLRMSLRGSTYATVLHVGNDGLSDDEDDTFILTGRNSESELVLFAAEVSPQYKIFRPFLTRQFKNVSERTCGASGKIDGKVVTVLLGYGNKVLVFTDNKELWQIFTM